MKLLLLAPLAVTLLSALVLSLQDEPPAVPGERSAAEPPAAAFGWKELVQRAAQGEGRYLEFLDRASLSAGVYRIPAGEADHQQPHALDEVYYVVAGRAGFEAGGERWDAAPGSVLFVAAGVEHRFVDIVEDLEVLVLFSKGPAAKR